MSLIAHLVDNLYDTHEHNSHDFWAPGGVWIGDAGQLWVADRNHSRIVGVTKGSPDTVIPTLDHPNIVAQSGENLLVCSLDSDNNGGIVDLQSLERKELPVTADVYASGDVGYALRGWRDERRLEEVTSEGSRRLLSSNGISMEGVDYIATCTDMSLVTADGKDVYLLVNLGSRKYSASTGGAIDYWIFKFTEGSTPKPFFEVGDINNVMDMCIDSGKLYLLRSGNGEKSIESISLEDVSDRQKVKFEGHNPLERESDMLLGLSVRTQAENTLMALVTSYHVGTYELKQE